MNSKALDVLSAMGTFALTPASARKADALSADDTRKAAATVAEHKGAADRIVGDVMWEAGLLTHYVTDTSKAIGRDGLWEAQGDYAKAIGFSPAYVTRLKRLGRAAVVHGVRKGSARWTFLASYADRAEVGKAVALDDSAEFSAVVDAMIDATRKAGKFALPGQGETTPAIESGRATGGETDVTATEGTERVVRTLGDIREMARLLASALKDLSADDYSAAEDVLTGVLSNETTRRLTLAAAEARKANAGK